MTSLSRDGASTRAPAKHALWIGRALSGLVLLFLAMDAGGKLIAPELMIAHSPPLGLPADAGFMRLLGTILLACAALYAWPRTALLGAVLLTGSMGGAIASHLRLGDPLFSHTLFGVYLGMLFWVGLWLRDERVRRMMPTLA